MASGPLPSYVTGLALKASESLLRPFKIFDGIVAQRLMMLVGMIPLAAGCIVHFPSVGGGLRPPPTKEK